MCPKRREMRDAGAQPYHILFLCNMNAIRSPMAEAIARDLLGRANAGAVQCGQRRKVQQMQVSSAGLFAGEVDFFVREILAEIGLSLPDHRPRALSSLDISMFDKIIALTGDARRVACSHGAGARVEYWPISNPTDIRENGRAHILAAYRLARNEIYVHIQQLFCMK